MRIVAFGDAYDLLALLGAHPLDTAVGHSPFAVGALRLPDTTDAGAVAAFVRLGRALVRKCVIDTAPTTLLLVVDGSGYDDITPAMEACRDFARRAYETADFFADYSLRVVPVVLSHIDERETLATLIHQGMLPPASDRPHAFSEVEVVSPLAD